MSVTVIGSGIMGTGIAYVCALNGRIPVTLVDTSEKQLENAKKYTKKTLQEAVSRKKVTAAKADEAFNLIRFTTDLEGAVRDVDFVIEAVPERLDLKKSIFQRVEKTAKKSTILATNTSSISITKIATGVPGAEDRVIGVHFFSPVPKMKGVEIIKGLLTSEDTYTKSVELVKKFKKSVSTVIDSPGFLVNRILSPYLSQAIQLYENGYATAEDIDRIMVDATGMPMGPLRLADFIGLDTLLSVDSVLRDTLGEIGYPKSVLMQKLVDAGHLGIKTGKGFHTYKSKL